MIGGSDFWFSNLAKFLQGEPKPDQEKPRKQAWIFLDKFGFLRPIRGFSKGYGRFKAKMSPTPAIATAY